MSAAASSRTRTQVLEGEEHEVDDLTFGDLEDEFDEETLDDINFDIELAAKFSAESVEELAALIAAIGTFDKRSGDFSKGEYCYEAVARLEYLLRHDGRVSDERPVASELYRKCGEFRLVSNVLCPLLVHCRSDLQKHQSADRQKAVAKTRKLVTGVVKMLARLTQPILSNDLRFVENMQRFKSSLIGDELVSFLVYLMAEPLTLEPEDRGERDNETLELYLFLIRNVLAIPNPANASHHLAQLHDRCVVATMREGVMDVCIELAKNAREENDSVTLLLLDVFYHFFRLDLDNVNELLAGRFEIAAAIGNVNVNGTAVDNGSDDAVERGVEMRAAKRAQQRMREKQQCNELKRLVELDKLSRKRTRGVRHNRWGGLRRVRGIGGKIQVQRGATRLKSLKSPAPSLGSAATKHMHARRKAARFRPLKEVKKRLYLNEKVRDALCYVASKFCGAPMSALLSHVQESLSSMIEHELREAKETRRWYRLAYFSLQFHRVKATAAAEFEAIQKRNAQIIASDEKKSETADDSTSAVRNGADDANISTGDASAELYSLSPVSCLIKPSVIQFVTEYVEMLIENRKIKHLGISGNQVAEALHLYKEMVRAMHAMVTHSTAQRQRGLELFSALIIENGKGATLLLRLISEYQSNKNTKHFLALCLECLHFVFELSRESSKASFATHFEGAELGEDGNGDEEFKLEEDMAVDFDIEDQKEDGGEKREIKAKKKKRKIVRKVSSDLLSLFATNRVLFQYVYVLGEYESNACEVNRYVVSFLERVVDDLQLTGLLFHVNNLLLFDRILSDRRYAYLFEDMSVFKRLKAFALKVSTQFLESAATNPVLWCDALFFKSRPVLTDIQNPGSLSALMHASANLRGGRKRKGKTAFEKSIMAIDGFDDIDDDDFDDDEDAYELKEYKAWSREEDELLRAQFATYAEESNAARLLTAVLSSELKSEREEAEVRRRLKQLGLVTKRGAKRKGNNSAQSAAERALAKRRWKRPQESDWMQNRVSATFARMQRTEVRTEERSKCFEALLDLLRRFDEMVDAIGCSRVRPILQPLSLIPVTDAHFAAFEDAFVTALLKAVGFIPPSLAMGYAFWKLPVGYVLSDVKELVLAVDKGVNAIGDEDMAADATVEMAVGSEVVGDSDEKQDANDANEIEKDKVEELEETVAIDSVLLETGVIESESVSNEAMSNDSGEPVSNSKAPQSTGSRKRKAAEMEIDDQILDASPEALGTEENMDNSNAITQSTVQSKSQSAEAVKESAPVSKRRRLVVVPSNEADDDDFDLDLDFSDI